MGIIPEVEEALSCKVTIYSLGGVVTALAGVIVAMAKIGWNHILDDLKIARDREATLNVAKNSALQKKGDSPQ